MRRFVNKMYDDLPEPSLKKRKKNEDEIVNVEVIESKTSCNEDPADDLEKETSAMKFNIRIKNEDSLNDMNVSVDPNKVVEPIESAYKTRLSVVSYKLTTNKYVYNLCFVYDLELLYYECNLFNMFKSISLFINRYFYKAVNVFKAILDEQIHDMNECVAHECFNTLQNCFNLLITDLHIEPCKSSKKETMHDNAIVSSHYIINNIESEKRSDREDSNNLCKKRDIYSITINENKNKQNYMDGYINLLYSVMQVELMQYMTHIQNYQLDTWYINTVLFNKLMGCHEQYELYGVCKEFMKYISDVSHIDMGKDKNCEAFTSNAVDAKDCIHTEVLVEWQYCYIYRLFSILNCIVSYHKKYYQIYNWCRASIHNLIDCLCKQRVKCFVNFPSILDKNTKEVCDLNCNQVHDGNDDLPSTINYQNKSILRNTATITPHYGLRMCLSQLDVINEEVTQFKYKQAAGTVILNGTSGSSFTGGSCNSDIINTKTVKRTSDNIALHPLRNIKK